MLPLDSRRSPTPSGESKISGGYLTVAFFWAQKRAQMLRHRCILGVPNAKSTEQNRKVSRAKRNKIRIRCCTPAFSGPQKRAEMLRHPCILGAPQQEARGAKSEIVPNKGEQNQKWCNSAKIRVY